MISRFFRICIAQSLLLIMVSFATIVMNVSCGVKSVPLPPLEPVEISKSQDDEMKADRKEAAAIKNEGKNFEATEPKKKRNIKGDNTEEKK